MPYAGRGGSGNILAASQESQRVAEDLEANHQTSPPSAQTSPREDAQYAHTGRGGAGNYYSPKELSASGVYKDTDFSAVVGDGVNTLGNEPVSLRGGSVAGGAEPPRTYGRGGAGNYYFDSSENQERATRLRMEEEERKKVKVKEEVERDVSEMLATPPKAKLPREEAF